MIIRRHESVSQHTDPASTRSSCRTCHGMVPRTRIWYERCFDLNRCTMSSIAVRCAVVCSCCAEQAQAVRKEKRSELIAEKRAKAKVRFAVYVEHSKTIFLWSILVQSILLQSSSAPCTDDIPLSATWLCFCCQVVLCFDLI